MAVLVEDASTEPGEPFGLRHTGRTTLRIPVLDAWLLSRGMVNLFPHSSVNRPFVGPGLRELYCICLCIYIHMYVFIYDYTYIYTQIAGLRPAHVVSCFPTVVGL